MPLPAYYNTNPNLNVTINGINIGEGMARADMNNALRQMMADIKSWTDTYAVAVPITIANGGTGSTTAAAARTALGAFPAAGGAIAADSTIDGKLTRLGYGVHPHFASTSMTGGRIYVQALGADPTSNPGDIVFEY